MNSTTLNFTGYDDTLYKECIKTLSTNIIFSGNNVKVIAFTSCTPREGKSLITLNTARALTELGKRVLVIDCNMRAAVKSRKSSALKNAKGLSEVLSGTERLSNCVYNTQCQNLHTILAGNNPKNPVELLNSNRFLKQIETVSRIYDYVLVDTPYLGTSIDAAVAASRCDSAIIIAGREKLKRAQIQRVSDQLSRSGCNVMGIVLNNAQNKKRVFYGKEKRMA